MEQSNSVTGFLSNFQFVTSRIIDISFHNESLCEIEDGCKKDIDLDYGNIIISESQKPLLGSVTLDINVNVANEENHPAKLKYSIMGVFSTTESDKVVDFEQMIKINGLATLYSIARAHIIAISSLTGIGPINIPMINVYEFVRCKNVVKPKPSDNL